MHRLLTHHRTGDVILCLFFSAIFTVLIHG